MHTMVLYPQADGSMQVKKLPKVFFTLIHLETPLLLRVIGALVPPALDTDVHSTRHQGATY